MLPGEAAQARAFRAQRQPDLAGQLGLGQGLRRFGSEAGDPEAALLEKLDRAREVGDPDQRHMLERAGGCLGQRPGFRRRVALGQDDRERAEGGGRAQDRADILRVGHLVEDHQPRMLRALGCGDHILDAVVGQRMDPGCQPLMNGTRRQPAFQDVARDTLPFMALDRRHLVGSGMSQAQDLPLWVGERGGQRMMSI